jgi:Fe2+ transport system protein FeoA
MKTEQVTPLSSIKAGQTARLVSINAGRALKSRLSAMGLVPNVQLTVVNNGHPGPVVLSVRGSRLMLGRGMADKVMVVQV